MLRKLGSDFILHLTVFNLAPQLKRGVGLGFQKKPQLTGVAGLVRLSFINEFPFLPLPLHL